MHKAEIQLITHAIEQIELSVRCVRSYLNKLALEEEIKVNPSIVNQKDIIEDLLDNPTEDKLAKAFEMYEREENE